MSARYKCNTCQQEFFVTESTGSQSCPFCESSDIAEKSGGISVNTSFLKKLWIPAVVVVLILVIILIFSGGGKGPVITKVESDKENCRITVTAKASSAKGKIQYSYDNGKTYQNVRVFKVQDPGTYIVVVRDDKKRITTWAVPQTFSQEDLNNCMTPVKLDIQITGVEFLDETEKDKNDGQIKIHTINGVQPVKFSVDAGASYSPDSIFNGLKPGKYVIQVEDGSSMIASWSDTIKINPGVINLPPRDTTIIIIPKINRPTKALLESKLNRLFTDPDNTRARDSLLKYFVNQTMPVDCELIGIPSGTPYQLYQFLERRFEGLPGSKRIEVIDFGLNQNNLINRFKVREIKVQVN